MDREQECSIIYDCRWSTEVDDKFINDFITVERNVFGSYRPESFRKKYLNNIFGPSVLCVVYIDGKPSAARALWRNDIGHTESYQPIETCVLEQCRGKGVFSEMTRKAISLLPKESVIYNFPNLNSYPGYIKLGWKLVNEYRMVLLTNFKDYHDLHPVQLDKRYFNWWIKGTPGIKYIKRFGKYFLVKKYSRPFCWKVISEVDKEMAKCFSCLYTPSLIFYSGIKKTFYNSRFATSHIVAKTDKHINIPVWKIDVI